MSRLRWAATVLSVVAGWGVLAPAAGLGPRQSAFGALVLCLVCCCWAEDRALLIERTSCDH